MPHKPSSFFLIVPVICGLVSGSLTASAQSVPVLDSNPASVGWRTIKTPSFRIIFPDGFEEQGQRMANTLEHIRTAESRSIGSPSFPRMPVILQNRSSISNGFVSLAPLRSEFFSMPSQNYNFLGNNDWLDLLASHEYRHMAQFRQSARGFNRLFRLLFGQEALAVMSYLSVPPWFWEGDAVVTESAFTSSGRGRIPHFDLMFRTNLMEGRVFDYDKQHLRSYRNYIPNHYVLGYHMVSYLRERTDSADVWADVTRRTWSVPFLPMRFSGSIRKSSGLTVGRLYKEMALKRISEWEALRPKVPLTRFEVLSIRRDRSFTDYEHPQYFGDGSVVALKSGIGHIQQFVRFREGREEPVHTPGVVNESGMLSASGTRMVWNEYRYDPRWPARSWSVVRVHHIDSGRFQARTLTHKTRYSGASLAPDGRRVATVESAEDYQLSIVLIDALTGAMIRRLPNPDGAYYSMVRWAPEGNALVALRVLKGEKSIVKLSLDSGSETILLAAGEWNVGNPVLHGRYLLFSAPLSGIDNIAAMDLETGARHQVTVSEYGAYDAAVSPDGRWIVYSNQSPNGLDVVRMPFDPTAWRPMEEERLLEHHDRADFLAKQEGRPGLFDTIPSALWPVRRYHRGLRMVKPHSWGAYVSTDLTRASVGITSRDLLSTLSFYAGFEMDVPERTGSWRTRASLQALYPIVDAEHALSDRQVRVADELEFIESVSNGDTARVVAPLSFSWREESTELGLRLPLNLTASRFFTQVNFYGGWGRTVVRDFKNSYDGGGRFISEQYPQYFFRSYQDDGRLVFTRFQSSAYFLMRKSLRDINSRWGNALFVTAQQSVPGSDFQALQSSVTDYLYFPGLYRHHSLWGYWAFQNTRIDWRSRTDYTFRSQIPLPRGAAVSRFEKMYSMSLNYTLPLWYPDFNIGPLVNLKRVRFNGFGDYAFGENPALSQITRTPQAQTYFSAGGELRFDLNFFRLLPEFDLGIRVVQVVRPRQDTVVELVLGSFNF